MQLHDRGCIGGKRWWRVRGVGPAGNFRCLAALAILGAVLFASGVAHAELGPAPSREVASKCRVLAYTVYPVERPGHSPGSGARYALFKQCIDKGGQVDATTPAPSLLMKPPPRLGPPPASQPAPLPASPPPDPPK